MTRFKIIACTTVALSAPGLAQNAPISRTSYLNTVNGHFNGADANHDGFMSRAELTAQQDRDLATAKSRVNKQLQESFNRLDTNHDGKLSFQEFLAAAPPMKVVENVDQTIARLDANRDGKISAEEYRNPELAKFNRVDANRDGIVTPQEIQAARGK